MKRCSLLSLAATIVAALAAPTLSHADTFTLKGSGSEDFFTTRCYQAPGAPFESCGPQAVSDPLIFSGTVDVDPATYLVTGANISVFRYRNEQSYSFATNPVQADCRDGDAGSCVSSGTTNTLIVQNLAGLELSFLDPVTGPYLGGVVSLTSPFGKGTGSLTLSAVTVNPGPTTPAVAATPEPSSLILLGTGILGVAGAARRRFLA